MTGIILVVCETTHVFNLADDCRCPNKSPAKIIERHVKSIIYDAHSRIPSAHKLAVLVPYRDRFEELLAFAPYLHNFLNKQEVSHRIYILNQVHML
jgi:xylosylprotein 4-beta-galactosyltransferase